MRLSLAALALATGLALASTAVRGTAVVVHQDVMGCEAGCDVAAVGWPVPFIVDYPAISPVGSASLSGAVLGLDRWRGPAGAATFGFWTVLVFGVVWSLGDRFSVARKP